MIPGAMILEIDRILSHSCEPRWGRKWSRVKPEAAFLSIFELSNADAGGSAMAERLCGVASYTQQARDVHGSWIGLPLIGGGSTWLCKGKHLDRCK